MKSLKKKCELCELAVSGEHWSSEWCNDTGLGVVLHYGCSVALTMMGKRRAVRVLRKLRGAA
jgi:hypothetical protein